LQPDPDLCKKSLKNYIKKAYVNRSGSPFAWNRPVRLFEFFQELPGRHPFAKGILKLLNGVKTSLYFSKTGSDDLTGNTRGEIL